MVIPSKLAPALRIPIKNGACSLAGIHLLKKSGFPHEVFKPLISHISFTKNLSSFNNPELFKVIFFEGECGTKYVKYNSNLIYNLILII